MNPRAFFALLLLIPAAAPALARDLPRRDRVGDPLPAGALARLGTIRLRSDNGVTCLAFSGDGAFLLTGGFANKVAFWDVAAGKLARQITVHSSSVAALQLTADGKTLAVTGGDGVFRILDAVTGAEKKALDDPQPGHASIVAFLSPDGKTAVMIYRYRRHLLIWDVPGRTVKHRIANVSAHYPAPVAFTPDSKQFVTLWTDNRLHLVDAATGKSVRCLEPKVNVTGASTYTSRIASLALTPDGKRLVYRLSSESACGVMELATGKVVRRIEKPSRYASSNGSFAVTANGRFLIEANGEAALRVWDLASGKLMRELTSPAGSLSQVVLSPDGKTAGSFSGHCLFLWDVASGRLLHPGVGHHTAVHRLAFTPDGKGLISVGSTTLRVWDLDTSRERGQTRTSSLYSIHYLRASADGKSVSYIGPDKAFHVWWIGVDPQPKPVTMPKPTPYCTSQTVSPDGKLLAAINSSDHKVRLIELLGDGADRELATLANPYNNQLIFSPDGRTLVLSAADRSVTFFDVATGAETCKLMPGLSNYSPFGSPMIVFSRDSRTAIVCDGDLKVFEMVSGRERLRLPAETAGTPNLLAWSDNGRLLARAYGDGVVIVHDTWTGQELLRRNGGQGSLTSVVFSPDGRKVATGGANTTVLVWETPAPTRSVRLKRDDDSAWRDLENVDASRAFSAMTHLASAPAETIRLFQGRLKPPPPADARRIGKLIVDLDNDSYAVREKASEELAAIGAAAESALTAAAKSPTAEVKRRAEDLLTRLRGGPNLAPERMRAQRAVEVLEMIGTPAARTMLQSMLDKTKMRLDAELEAAIKESLERLGEAS